MNNSRYDQGCFMTPEFGGSVHIICKKKSLKMKFLVFVIIAPVFSLICACAPVPRTAPKIAELVISQNTNWIEVDGQRRFWFGVNYPWFGGYQFRGIDIGGLRSDKSIKLRSGDTFGPGESAFNENKIDIQMKDMRSIGVRVVRWFIGYDARGVFAFDQEGFCTGLTPYTLENFRRVVDMAEKNRLKLYPSLLNFHFICGTYLANKNKPVKEIPIFMDGTTQEPMGWIFKDPEKRRALIEKGIIPLVRQCANSNAILAWEIMNEPGNVIVGKDPVTGLETHGGDHLPKNAQAQLTDMQAFFNEAYDAIKVVDQKHPVNPAGDSSPWRLKLWVGRTKADFYGAYYNDFGKDYGKVKSVKDLEKYLHITIDKPLLMTESVADLEHELPYYVEAAYKGGWAGILTWNYYTTLHGIWGHDFRDLTSETSQSLTPDYLREWQKNHRGETEFHTSQSYKIMKTP